MDPNQNVIRISKSDVQLENGALPNKGSGDEYGDG
jgi:hypothetical protein